MEDDSILKSKITASSLNQNLENFIYEIRGQQVMLDSDLAKLYQVETRQINEAVRRNKEKFPERFSFVLTKEEADFLRSKKSTLDLQSKFSTAKSDGTEEVLRSQFATLKNSRGRHNKYLPRVFTEQGIYMLATILKSKVATEVSIAIMDTFVNMRHYINYNSQLLPNKILLLEEKVDDNTKRINELFDKFDPSVIAKDYIFFEGELYDAYSLLLDIFSSAKEEIIIIDNYIGKELLDILKNIKKRIIINSKNINNTLKKKYESQYKNITFLNNNSFHDRFIILDKRTIYHSGASFKDLGKKCFAIHRFNDREYLEKLLDAIRPKNML